MMYVVYFFYYFSLYLDHITDSSNKITQSCQLFI